MKIIPLSEGAFTIDKTKQFVPFNLDSDNLQDRPTGSLLVEIQPFVIITGKDILLLDTGLGFTSENGRLQIHNNLQANGIDPADITKVLMSHLHKDHAGGIAHEGTLSFPNATYYVNQQEFEHAIDASGSSYVKKDFEILKHSKQLQLLDDKGKIGDNIRYELTGGHSAFHQVFWITEGKDTVFFGGDVAPQLQQMKSRFIAKYDFDGKRSMELRHQWWEEGKTENWSYLFYHDIKKPVYQHP